MRTTDAGKHNARWQFFAVRFDEVQQGDLYANHSTVTEVVKGPRTVDDNPKSFDNVKRGQTLFRCGEAFGCKGKNSNLAVVGRLRPTPAAVPDSSDDTLFGGL